jgi:hypothetical protein
MHRRAWIRWLFGLSAIAVLAMAGVYVYDMGVAHGLAQATRAAGGGGASPPFIGWWRPWGFGFGFFPFFPFLLVLLWFVALRGLFWRRSWYARRWGGPGWSDGCGGAPRAFEEWHRRAHDRQVRPSAGTEV